MLERRSLGVRAVLALALLLPAAARPEGRPFLASSGRAIADFGTAPLRAGWRDLLWAAPAALAIGVTLNHDLQLYGALAKGPARHEVLDHSMPAVSALGDGLIEFAGAALLNRVGDERLAATSAVAMQALLVSAAWSQAFKFAAWSNRPYIDDSAHRFFAYGQDSTGFPSGHSFSAFAAAEVYGAEYGRWISYPFAGLVAYSRVYNQDHWPSDVVTGAVLGVVAGVQARRAAAQGGPPLIRFSLGQRGAAPLMVAHADF